MERTITGQFKAIQGKPLALPEHLHITNFDLTFNDLDFIERKEKQGWQLLGITYGYTDNPNYCVDCGKYIVDISWFKTCKTCYKLNK